MKVRSLVYLIGSLTILCTGYLPSMAQSRRYPTDAEIRRLMPILGRGIESNRSFVTLPRRTNDARSFSAAWSRVDRSTAPFLGIWASAAVILNIYPSNTQGRVCIILEGADGDVNSHFEFKLGYAVNGQLRTDSRSMIVRQGDSLGEISIESNQSPSVIPYLLIEPVKPLSNLQRFDPLPARIIQQFKAAGCTASRPTRK